ncbi:efflux RND transporter periplasmic adaptor subunit [Cellulosimicrobium cellulans]|uniref:efflux RND transporter periplasmic adaptor subunit n=1 Tax=Cellulosimicrobium cellulans TaxID=1710 RepID=UPI0036E304BE
MNTTKRPTTPPDAAAPGRSRPRRRLVLGICAGVACLGLAAGGVLVATASDGNADKPISTFQGATDAVTRADLQEATSVVGTLQFAGSQTLQAAASGVLTDMAVPGTVVGLGQRLYAIDNAPVFLLRGGLPAWRDFAAGMSDGPDVKQLETSLRELGHFDKEPDERFTWVTAQAIRNWQKANGLRQTGGLPLGTVVFSAADLRVGTASVSLGSPIEPGTELFATTSTNQVVNLNLRLADQGLAVVGASVQVRLPGGAQTTGTISSVGTPTENEGTDGQKQTVIPVSVNLDDPTAAAGFQEASVTVELPSERREDVYSVPVGALVALSADQFGIEVVDADGTTRKIPVTAGLFAGGRVEISGEGVSEGQRVVVPQR